MLYGIATGAGKRAVAVEAQNGIHRWPIERLRGDKLSMPGRRKVIVSARSAVATADEIVEMELEERRTARRTMVSLRARLRLSNGVLLDALTADISRAGIGFFAPRHLPVKHECQLFVDLSSCGTEMELKLAGRVYHCVERSPGVFRVGLRYAGLESEAIAFLHAMLD